MPDNSFQMDTDGGATLIIIDKSSNIKLYDQIYLELREKILNGMLSEGSKLPSTRELAKTLQVSRNTVETAYLQLSSEGYVKGIERSGYRVRKIEGHYLTGQSPTELVHTIDGKTHEQGLVNNRNINFQYGKLSIADFPMRTYRRVMNQCLLSHEIEGIAAYNDRKGEADLRRSIINYIYDHRGVQCRPEQVIVGAGTLVCLGLITQLLMGKSRRIAMEEPCYDAVRSFLINQGFEIMPVLTESDGIDVQGLITTYSGIVYLTPSHQFPTGSALPVSKRIEILKWAKGTGAFIIEDDYDSEFRYSSRPIPSLQSLDNEGRVIYLNTFSKSLAPGLRMSFMVLPQALLLEYELLFGRYNCSVPWLEQKVMSAFMQEGHWGRHLRKICQANKRRNDTLITGIRRFMGNKVVIHGEHAGLHILLEVRNGDNEAQLISKAYKAGVTVYPVSIYYTDKKYYTDNMVLIGFSSLSEEEIIRGIQLLCAAWF